jgi:hypothetical protein
MSEFDLGKLENDFNDMQKLGYKFLSCREYCNLKASGALPELKMIIRVDVDFSLSKAIPILDIFKRIGICATFFLRLHAEEYNPFSIENYKVIKRIVRDGHEIGYHSEVIDQSSNWNENPDMLLRRDIEILSLISGTEIRGVASHGGNTGLNNLDFWVSKRSDEFNLDYEAYDRSEFFGAFWNSVYVSDSSWTEWKSYRNGKLIEGVKSSFIDYARKFEENIYLLIHPDTFFSEE